MRCGSLNARCRLALFGLLATVGCAARNGGTPPVDAAVGTPTDGAMAATDAAVDAGADAAAPADLALRVCDVKAYGAEGRRRHQGHASDPGRHRRLAPAARSRSATASSSRACSSLQSHVTLDIDASATLLGSQDIADYPDRNPPVTNTQLSNCKKALLYAESADDIHIQGQGTIDGNAAGVRHLERRPDQGGACARWPSSPCCRRT